MMKKRSANAARNRWKKMEAAAISEELQNDENEYQIEADDIESFGYEEGEWECDADVASYGAKIPYLSLMTT
ncbi:hypothetical protein Tco_1393045 [Tanacetum coccineum]